MTTVPSQRMAAESPAPSRPEPDGLRAALRDEQRGARSLLQAQCPKPLRGCLLTLLEATPASVMVWNRRNRLLYMNTMGRSLLSIDREANVVARSLSEFYTPHAYRRLVDEAIPACISRGVWHGESTMLDQTGSDVAVSQVLVVQRLAEPRAGDEFVFSSIAWDMREHKQTERQLRHQATHDSLTGLPNRALLVDRLGHALHAAKRDGSVAAVIFIDLDDFKGLNDRFGHERANEMLIEIARRLKAGVRAADTVARYAGDEFVVLVSGLTAPADLERIRRLVRKTFSQPVMIGGEYVHVRASVGVAVYPGDGDDARGLLRKADVLMYEAKAGHKRREGRSADALGSS